MFDAYESSGYYFFMQKLHKFYSYPKRKINPKYMNSTLIWDEEKQKYVHKEDALHEDLLDIMQTAIKYSHNKHDYIAKTSTLDIDLPTIEKVFSGKEYSDSIAKVLYVEEADVWTANYIGNIDDSTIAILTNQGTIRVMRYNKNDKEISVYIVPDAVYKNPRLYELTVSI